jgi:hypothetical protein
MMTDSRSSIPSKYQERLLSQILAGESRNMTQKVAHILNQFPKARDSDKTLTIKLLQTFYPDYVKDGKICLEDLYTLPKFYDMQRARAKIQNEYGLFQASPAIKEFRRKHQLSEAEKYSSDQPDFSPVFILADESGKTGKFLILGSLWTYSSPAYHGAIKSLANWRIDNNHASEFHFSKIKDMRRARLALSFFESFVKESQFSAFKGLILNNFDFSTSRQLTAVYDGLAEMSISGVQSELISGRISPSITLHLVKDADPATDVLQIIEMSRRIAGALNIKFPDGSVRLNNDIVESATSESNDLVQIADLYTSSINRWINQKITDPRTDYKDWLAEHIGSIFNWHIEDGELMCDNDFCQLKYLSV